MTIHRHAPAQRAEHLRSRAHMGGKSILVPLDGSESSAAVIPVARVLGEVLGATVRIFHVADEPVEQAALMRRLRLKPREIIGLVVDSAQGVPLDEIKHAAARHHTRLVVMGTQGWTAEPERALGHVAEQALLTITQPLVLVRRDVGERFAARGRGLARILVPLDGSPSTAQALGPAAELACAADASLDIVHVVDARRPPAPEAGTMSVPMYVDQPHHGWENWSREFISRFCGCFHREPGNVLVAVGDPGAEIVRTAQQLDSDLIVLAWKGSLGDTHGATLRTVLGAASCPVMVLRVNETKRAQARPRSSGD